MHGGGGGGVSETFLNGKVTLWAGDCLEVLAGLPENSIDSADLRSLRRSIGPIGLKW